MAMGHMITRVDSRLRGNDRKRAGLKLRLKQRPFHYVEWSHDDVYMVLF